MDLSQLRQIPGHPDYYASADGDIYSLRKLSAAKGYLGYLFVSIVRGMVGRKTYKVHRLVALAWHGPPAEGQECCHSNGIRHDNRACNLRWGTNADNLQDKIKHGMVAQGETHPRARLTADDVRAIRTSPLRTKELAAQYGLHPTYVREIVRRKTWRHIP